MLLDLAINDEPTHADLLAALSRQLPGAVSYLEIGVSVGKTFLPMLGQVERATGLDLEELSPVIAQRLRETSRRSWATPPGRMKQTPSSVAEYDVIGQSSSVVTYVCADEFDPAGWEALGDRPFNLVLSDALHLPGALVEELHALASHSLLDRNAGAIVWDDLQMPDMLETFRALRAPLETYLGCPAGLFGTVRLRGWLGQHEPHHLVGVAAWGPNRWWSNLLDVPSAPDEPDPSPRQPDFGVGDEWVADIERRVRPFTMTTTSRVYALCLAVDHIQRAAIPGAIVECGVWRGGSAMAAALTLLRTGDTSRPIVLFDTFVGMTTPTEIDQDAHGRWAGDLLGRDGFESHMVKAEASLDEVRANLASVGYPSVEYVVGDVLTTIPSRAPDEIAVLRLDTDWYESTRHELQHLLPRVSAGGILIVDDYGHWRGARRAVDEYLAASGRQLFLCPLDYTGRLAVLS